jgi:hypothetical protein
MAIVSVYIQQPQDSSDHVLYGVVNAVSGSTVTVNNTGTNNWGGSITNATGPFTGAEGKVVRRYSSADWNGSPRPYALAANVGTVETAANNGVTNSGNSFTSTGISGTWAVGDVWAIEYHSPYSFGKYAEADKYGPIVGTADEEKARTAAGTNSSILPDAHMRPMFYTTAPKTGAKNEDGELINYQYAVFKNNGEQDGDPGTTKWQLRCDSLGRSYANSAIPLPMPSLGRGDQYYNMLLDIGMRQETINMSGTLVDRGMPTAENPRLQTIFDIVRTQHSSQLNMSEEAEKKREEDQTPSNTMAYLRLTIGSGYEPSDYQESTGVAAGATPPQTPTYNLNTNIIVRDRNYPPGGPWTKDELGTRRTEKAYRGLITQFSANLTGGKPDIWTWQMTFTVVKNEHDWTIKSK